MTGRLTHIYPHLRAGSSAVLRDVLLVRLRRPACGPARICGHLCTRSPWDLGEVSVVPLHWR
jgi:hypothetical protein